MYGDIEVADGLVVLADLKVGKPADAVAVDIIGNEIDRDRELFDRLIKIPIFYIFRTVVEMERRTGGQTLDLGWRLKL